MSKYILSLLFFSFLAGNGRPELYGPYSPVSTCQAQENTNLILIDKAYLHTLQEKVKFYDTIAAVDKATAALDKSLPPNPSITSSISTPTLKPVIVHRVYRTFQKICPECNTMCISTNLFQSGGSTTEKWSYVRFSCTNVDCNNNFQEELKEPIKKSEPMIEIK